MFATQKKKHASNLRFWGKATASHGENIHFSLGNTIKLREVPKTFNYQAEWETNSVAGVMT